MTQFTMQTALICYRALYHVSILRDLSCIVKLESAVHSTKVIFRTSHNTCNAKLRLALNIYLITGFFNFFFISNTFDVEISCNQKIWILSCDQTKLSIRN